MKVTFESSEDFPWKTYDCIVSARHFPLFSRLINIYVRFVLSECNVPVSSSEIVSTAHYLDISPVNRASIIEGLKRLGPALILDQDLTKSTIQFQSNQAIWGSESSATRPLSLLSKLALADLLGIAEDVGALFEQGRFRQVVHICDAAGHLVFTPAELYTPLTPQEKHQRLRAILHMEMIKCLSFTKLGEMEAAFECAFDTHVEFSGRERSNAHWQDPSSRQNIDLIANGLTDYGRLGAIEQVISSYRTKLRPLIRDRHPDFYDESRVMFEKLCKFQTHLWPDTVTDDMWSLDEPSTEPIK
ncbi:hypothetical protein MMC10_003667, partial [Thelotrema lepadinum]|nr:hypothetical protein [Thelotrema lepadinum]